MNPYDAPQSPGFQPPAQPLHGGKATAALVLGIISMLAWCLPILGFPISVTGLVLGVVSMRGEKRGMAITGIVLCAVGLLLSVANAALGVYLYTQGQHPLAR